MMPCKHHWDALKSEIDKLGLGPLVSKSGQEVATRELNQLTSSLEGAKPKPQDYDPLMALHWAISTRVLRGAPFVLFGREGEDGMPENKDKEGHNHYCPLCVVRRDFEHHLHSPGGRCGRPECKIVVGPDDLQWDKDWIESAGRFIYQQCKDKGILPAVN